VNDMAKASYKVREIDPFDTPAPFSFRDGLHPTGAAHAATATR